jgi:hypothetical protein
MLISIIVASSDKYYKRILGMVQNIDIKGHFEVEQKPNSKKNNYRCFTLTVALFCLRPDNKKKGWLSCTTKEFISRTLDRVCATISKKNVKGISIKVSMLRII